MEQRTVGTQLAIKKVPPFIVCDRALGSVFLEQRGEG